MSRLPSQVILTQAEIDLYGAALATQDDALLMQLAELALTDDQHAVIEQRAAHPDLPNPPAPYVPVSVTPRQARLALNAAGLLDQANTAVAAADEATQIAWNYASEIRRDNSIIAAMAGTLNLTKEQVDDLFRAAAAFGD